ncbi:DUF4239 domain-containing protein [Streptomyces sp. ODS28]|uniref:bestrophin-like domain n=1 Tax=Streptomyces sp. ODS28 TaxID=3136688 RepID=UPI0031E66ED8
MRDTLTALVFVLLLSGAVAGLYRWRQVRGDRPRDDDADVGIVDYATMWVGVLYAIMLGLAVVAVWDARNGASDNARDEAVALREIQDSAEVLPAAQHERIDRVLHDYVRGVVDDEWTQMRDHERMDPQSERRFQHLRDAVSDFQPKTAQQITVYNTQAKQLADATAARAVRGDDASQGGEMSPILWFGVVIGAVITIAFAFAYPITRGWPQLAVVTTMAAMIAYTLFVIWTINPPFGGSMPVEPDQLQQLLATGD